MPNQSWCQMFSSNQLVRLFQRSPRAPLIASHTCAIRYTTVDAISGAVLRITSHRVRIKAVIASPIAGAACAIASHTAVMICAIEVTSVAAISPKPLTIPWMNSTNIQATLSMPFRNAVKLMLESNAKLPARLLMRLAEDAATRSSPSAAANAPNERLSATIIGVTGARSVAATPNVASARPIEISAFAS